MPPLALLTFQKLVKLVAEALFYKFSITKETYIPSFFLAELKELNMIANWDSRSFHWEIKYTKLYLGCKRLSNNILGWAFWLTREHL